MISIPQRERKAGAGWQVLSRHCQFCQGQQWLSWGSKWALPGPSEGEDPPAISLCLPTPSTHLWYQALLGKAPHLLPMFSGSRDMASHQTVNPGYGMCTEHKPCCELQPKGRLSGSPHSLGGRSSFGANFSRWCERSSHWSASGDRDEWAGLPGDKRCLSAKGRVIHEPCNLFQV